MDASPNTGTTDGTTDGTAEERQRLLERITSAEAAVDDIQLNETVARLLTVPLTIRQLKVLGVIIAGNGSVSAQQLASLLHVSLATISGIVDRLVESDMAVRAENPNDHRAALLVPTEAGTAVFKDLMATSTVLRDEAVARMAINDLRALAQGIDALVAAVVGLAAESSGGNGQD
ncbi:MAG: MarR family transcriptional regulator [Glaciihabitans sp.]|nr:MarR family transcriptional regulator [Glaciihabitans sp.]